MRPVRLGPWPGRSTKRSTRSLALGALRTRSWPTPRRRRLRRLGRAGRARRARGRRPPAPPPLPRVPAPRRPQPRTIARDGRRRLRRYFGWLAAHGRDRGRPDRGLSAPRGEAACRACCASDELASCCSTSPSDGPPTRSHGRRTPRRRRARAALRQRVCGSPSCAGCGLDDVDLRRRRVIVWGKGAKQRRVPHERAVGRGRARLADHGPSAPRPPTSRRPMPLFLNRRGRRLTPRDVRRILDRRAAEPDPSPRPAPHLRHPPARRWCRSASRAGAPGPRRPGDDPGVHSREQGATRARVRVDPPEGITTAVDDNDDAAAIERALERLQGTSATRSARPPDRPLLAAGEVRRRPRRRRASRRTSSRPTWSATASSG